MNSEFSGNRPTGTGPAVSGRSDARLLRRVHFEPAIEAVCNACRRRWVSWRRAHLYSELLS